MPRDYEALAFDLLGDTLDDPPDRARRIAAVYAALYLEDPLVHQWCGLAAFVARHIGMGLEANLGPLQAPFARGNLAVYRDVVPEFLRFRDGAPVRGELEGAFNQLRRADQVALRDLDAAEAHAWRGLIDMSVVEQTVMCQPVYDEMGETGSMFLQPFCMFRMGFDTAAPILHFEGWNPGDLAQRMAWVKGTLLPAWASWRQDHGEQLRADLDLIRRDAGVRLRDLPPARIAA